MSDPTPTAISELLQHAGMDLAYRVRRPQPSTSAYPLLLLLHGVGANEAGLAPLALMQDPGVMVVLPRGPLTLGPGQHAWFQVQFTAQGPVIQPAQAEASRQALVRFIDQLRRAYPVDPRQVYIAGFSQGGIMSASVALTRPDKVAGFGLLSGRILPEIGPLTAPRTALSRLAAFVSHGVRDSKLPLAHAERSRELLASCSVVLAYREYDADHEITPAMAQDFSGWLSTQVALADAPPQDDPVPAAD